MGLEDNFKMGFKCDLNSASLIGIFPDNKQ